MKYILKTVLVTLLILLTIEAKSSHAAAIDINYTNVGVNQYKITLRVYRDCNGINLPSSTFLDYSSVSCALSGQFPITRDTIKEVSEICDSMMSLTTCGSGNFPGIEEHIYTTIITLPASCSDWVLSYSKCCRNTAISNLRSFNYNLFTSVSINNTVSTSNSSPVFNDIPIVYACVNEKVNFSNNVIDPDGDSLSFKLKNPKTSLNSNIPYKAGTGYTPTNPLTTVGGFQFDSTNGHITFTSPSIQQPIITIEITEYDSVGNIKGTLTRDIQFVILNCWTNANSYISGVDYDSINYSYKGCYGDSVIFDIRAIATDSTSIIKVIKNNLPPNSTLNLNYYGDTCRGTFRWKAPKPGNYFFTLVGEVDQCPLKKKSSFTYSILIDSIHNVCLNPTVYLDSNGKVGIDSSFVKNISQTNCPIKSIKISRDSFGCADLGANYVDVYTTDIFGNVDSCVSIVTVVDNIAPVISCNFKTIHLSSGGNYIVNPDSIINSYWDNCPGYSVSVDRPRLDCRSVGANPIVVRVVDNAGNYALCASVIIMNDTTKPTARCTDTTLYINSSGIVVIDPSFINKGSFDNCDSLTYRVSKDTFDCHDIGENAVTLYVTDLQGNIDSCTGNVTIRGYNGSKAICIDTTIYLTSSGIVVIDSSFVSSTILSECIQYTTTISKDTFDCTNIGINYVTVIAIDSFGNIDSCTAIVTVRDTIKSGMFAGNDAILCYQNSMSLNAIRHSPTSTGMWSSGSSTSTFFLNPSSNATTVRNLIPGNNVIVWSEWDGHCPTFYDTININVISPPTPNAGNDSVICNYNSAAVSFQLNGNIQTGKYKGKWRLGLNSRLRSTIPTITNDTVHNTTVTNLVNGTYDFIWEVKPDHCPAKSDTVHITIVSPPNVYAGVDSSYCDKSQITLNASPISSYSTGTWIVDTSFNPSYIPTIINPNSPITNVNIINEGEYRFLWKVNAGNCFQFADAVNITIFHTPVVNLGPDLSLCGGNSVGISGNNPGKKTKVVWTNYHNSHNRPVVSISMDSIFVRGIFPGSSYSFSYQVTNGVCLTITDSITIKNNFIPKADFSIDTNEICERSYIQFFDNSTVNPIDSISIYKWTTNGSNYFGKNQQIQYNDSGFYDVELVVTTNKGCSDTLFKQKLIKVITSPIAGFTHSKEEYDVDDNSQFVHIKDASVNASIYHYTFGDGNESNDPNPKNEYGYSDVVKYTISQFVTSKNGCTDSIKKDIRLGFFTVIAPNSFTPNNDGLNDNFKPIIIGNKPSEYFLSIYNRWGEKIFETNSVSEGWRGTHKNNNIQLGTYIWKLDVKFDNNGTRRQYSGHLNLIK